MTDQAAPPAAPAAPGILATALAWVKASTPHMLVAAAAVALTLGMPMAIHHLTAPAPRMVLPAADPPISRPVQLQPICNLASVSERLAAIEGNVGLILEEDRAARKEESDRRAKAGAQRPRAAVPAVKAPAPSAGFLGFLTKP
jgi:hypothetical protein